MAGTARAVIERTHSSGIYLWVLEQNTAAQSFYDAVGGTRAGRGTTLPPGGDPARLNGTPGKLRYAWSDPSVLFGQA